MLEIYVFILHAATETDVQARSQPRGSLDRCSAHNRIIGKKPRVLLESYLQLEWKRFGELK